MQGTTQKTRSVESNPVKHHSPKDANPKEIRLTRVLRNVEILNRPTAPKEPSPESLLVVVFAENLTELSVTPVVVSAEPLVERALLV